jgi:hypothetical protein
MAVKRNQMAQALAKPQTVQRQALTVPNINTTAISPFGDNFNSLQQEAYGQALTNKAISGQGFDPQGGIGVAVAQIATAGIGAWAQNRARKDIAEREVGRQQQLSSLLTSNGYTPESANAITSMTTPESGASIISAFINRDMAKNDPATQLKLQQSQIDLQKSQLGLTTEKLQQNKLIAEAGKIRSESSGKGAEKAPAGYRFQKDGNLVAIPGGPASKLSAESAGKVALIKQGEQDINRFKNLITNSDGSFNRRKLASMDVPFSLAGGRQENSTLFNAINARLRLESGAAVPEAEVKRALKTFAPGAFDSNDTINSKINRMNEFFATAKEEIGQGRGATPTQQATNGQSAMSQQNARKNAFKILNIRDK